jgi:hypothetical protein
MTDPTGLRQALVQWLAEHEDDEHNAMPHVAAHPSVKDAFDRKLEGWADELLADPLAPLLAKLRAVEQLVAFYDRHEYETVIVDDIRRALDAS